MRELISFAFILFNLTCFAQVKIHSHNDYTHAKPLLQAYAYQAYQIEVDVFLIGDSLIVAHSKKDNNLSRTINTMYLDPIANLIKDEAKRGIKSKYDFRLMIDLKDSWENYHNENSDIPTSYISTMTFDDKGNLYLATRQGLVKIERK